MKIIFFFSKIQELDAELVKVKSKYVILLKEAQTPRQSEEIITDECLSCDPLL